MSYKATSVAFYAYVYLNVSLLWCGVFFLVFCMMFIADFIEPHKFLKNAFAVFFPP